MKVISKICTTCQTPYEAKRKNQLYCTDDCRTDANNQKQTSITTLRGWNHHLGLK